MTDICRLTINELDGLLATRPLEPELSIAKSLRVEAERLAAAVASWSNEEPTSEAKQQTMAATLDLRDRVHAVYRRLGSP